jgi:hypothetical protein
VPLPFFVEAKNCASLALTIAGALKDCIFMFLAIVEVASPSAP